MKNMCEATVQQAIICACLSHYSKSGGSSSLDVATGTRRPTPPGTGEVTGVSLSNSKIMTVCVCVCNPGRVREREGAR